MAPSATVVLGTKAESLDRLAPFLSTARCLPQTTFEVADWRASPDEVVARTLETLGGPSLVVRSSTLNEDTPDASNAGAYASILGVAATPASLKAAIDTVICSYGPSVSQRDQVLVQPLLTGVAHCGVLFTRSLQAAAPYFVVDVESSGATDGITGGTALESRLFQIRRDTELDAAPEFLRPVIDLARELEGLTGVDSLDIEFAIDERDDVYLLQVRPLAALRGRPLDADTDTDGGAFAQAREAAATVRVSAPGLAGPRTILSNMADWNVAELVGGHPQTLALSVFAAVVTDSAWRDGRCQLGYHEPPAIPLLATVAGRPFVDTRASFNSLLPASTPRALREWVVTEALDHLEANPHLHDKIEFEIVPTAFTADFERWASRYGRAGLEERPLLELIQHLRTHTEAVMRGQFRPLAELMGELDAMDAARDRATSRIADGEELWLARLLLGECRRRGFPAFAAVARMAFIGNAQLRALVNIGAVASSRADSFLSSLRTVAGDLAEATAGLGAGSFTIEALLEKFGHLRPGTFDITSRRYDEEPEAYFGGVNPPVIRPDGESRPTFEWSPAEIRSVAGGLNLAGFSMSADDVLGFIGESVIAREKAKFIVSKNVSDVLRIFTAWGHRHDLTRAHVANLTVDQIYGLDGLERGAARRIAQSLARASAQQHAEQRKVAVPDVIVRQEDLDCVQYVLSRPNFVGDSRVEAGTVFLSPRDAGTDIKGRIVLIESADPGFDWILGQGIAGLITKYGGAASHMAIRCAEFGIPAAIGAGARFDQLKIATRIVLDCADDSVMVMS